MNHVTRRREQKLLSKVRSIFTVRNQLGIYLLPVRAATGVKRGMTVKQAPVGNVRTCRFDAKGDAQVAITISASVPMRSTGAEHSVVVLKVL